MNLFQALNRIEELEEENRQLRVALMPMSEVPAKFGLSPAEGRLYLALEPGIRRSRAALVYAVTEGRDVEPKILDVTMFRVRKKIEPYGLVITNIFGQGFEMQTDPAFSQKIALRGNDLNAQ